MIRTLKFSMVLAATAFAVGCGNPTVTVLDPGSGDDGSTTATPTPTPTGAAPAIQMSLDNLTAGAISSDIGLAVANPAVMKINFTITPFNGFTGTVTVHASGASGAALPAGVVIADQQVDITGATAATGSLVIDASDIANAIPGTYNGLEVSATGGAVSADPQTFVLNLAANFHVQSKAYPAGTNNARDFWGPDPTVAGSKGIVVHIGSATSVSIEWTNNDGVNNHEIHRGSNTAGMKNPATFPAAADLAGDVPNGGTSSAVVAQINGTQANDIENNGLFPHGNAAIPPAGTTKRTFAPVDPTAVNVMDFHCHVHNAMPGRVTIIP